MEYTDSPEGLAELERIDRELDQQFNEEKADHQMLYERLPPGPDEQGVVAKFKDDLFAAEAKIRELQDQLEAQNRTIVELRCQCGKTEKRMEQLSSLLAIHAKKVKHFDGVLDSLRGLVAVVGLTAFKYEGQRAVLQEAVDLAQRAIAKAEVL